MRLSSKVVQATTLLCLTLAGFLLNTLVLLVFYKRPALRSPSNRFVLSLVTANFVTILGLVPIVIVAQLVRDPPVWLQDVMSGTHTLAVTTSVFSILAIALDRYNAVLSPLHYTMTVTRQRSRGMILAVWLISGLLSTPAYLSVMRRGYTDPDHQVLRLSYTLTLLSLVFTIPILTLMWVYARMYTAAHRTCERTRRQSLQTTPGDLSRGGSLEAPYPPIISPMDVIRVSKPPTLSQLHKRRCSNASISAILFREEGRAVKTAVMVITSFFFAWAPFFILLLVDTHSLVEEVPEICRFLGFLSVVLNTVLSPFLYVYRNDIARSEALRLVMCWRKGNMYKGNVLQHASRDTESKSEGGVRVRHQNSSNCDSMSVQSFQLPTNLSVECKQCAEIPQPPVADFVATYEVVDSPEDAKPVPAGPIGQTRTRGESVTFRLAFLPQRRCQACVRQNSDSSTGSGHPLLRETESPTPNLTVGGRRHELILSRTSSGEESPILRTRKCDSPKLVVGKDSEDVILELEEHPTCTVADVFQFQETSFEGNRDSWVSPEEVEDGRRREPPRQDSDVTVDSGVDLGMDRSHSSSSSLSAISPVVTRPKRHRHKLQRLAAVEDEDCLTTGLTPGRGRSPVKMQPCDFG